jgi:hypothetical protein
MPWPSESRLATTETNRHPPLPRTATVRPGRWTSPPCKPRPGRGSVPEAGPPDGFAAVAAAAPSCSTSPGPQVLAGRCLRMIGDERRGLLAPDPRQPDPVGTESTTLGAPGRRRERPAGRGQTRFMPLPRLLPRCTAQATPKERAASSSDERARSLAATAHPTTGRAATGGLPRRSSGARTQGPYATPLDRRWAPQHAKLRMLIPARSASVGAFTTSARTRRQSSDGRARPAAGEKQGGGVRAHSRDRCLPAPGRRVSRETAPHEP